MDTTQDTCKNKAVITVDEEMLRDHVAEVVRKNLEETLNGLLDAEADELCNARKYERNADRASTRAHYCPVNQWKPCRKYHVISICYSFQKFERT